MTFFTLYLLIIPLLCFLVRKHKRYHSLPFLLIILLGMIRYDTVTDYSAYVTAFWEIKKNVYDGWFESGYVLFNKLFTFSNWGFIFLFMICIYIPYVQILNIFKKYNIVLLGTLVFLFLGNITRYENIVRQGVSMGIFFYSFKYIKGEKFMKYLICTALAISFHTSAVILIPYYFLVKFAQRIKPPVIISGLLLLLFYLLYLNGIFSFLVVKILEPFPLYSSYIEKLDAGHSSTGLTPLFRGILAWLPCYFLSYKDDEDTRVAINMSWISGLCYMLVQNFIDLDRIIEYLYIFQVLAIALLLKEFFIRKNLVAFYSVLLSLFIYSAISVSRYYQDNIYYTIFSDRCMQHRFYKRPNVWDSSFEQKDITNRAKEEVCNP